MKKILLYAALVCAPIALLAGCGGKEKSSEPSSAVETTAAETTEAEATSAVTTATTAGSTQPATTTKPAETEPETTEAATEPKSYSHRFEITNTAFRTRSVPQLYYDRYETAPDTVPERPRKAIEEGRGMYGSPTHWTIDSETGNIFVCVAYSAYSPNLRDYIIYRIDTNTGEVFFCGDMSEIFGEPTPSPNTISQDIYGLFAVGGKPVLGTYSGLFFPDEETGSVVVIDRGFEPQAGDMYIAGDRVFFRCAGIVDGEVSVRYGIFDPATKSASYVDEFPDVEYRYAGSDLSAHYDNTNVAVEGEAGGEQKIVFEWD